MATVIDHILVELGFDHKKFDEATKKSAEAWLKIRQQAEDSRKHTEEPVNAMTAAFGTLTTKILGFAASLITVQKLAQFSVNLVKGNIDLRNLSATTQISIETLSKWGGMAERSGSSLQSISQAIAGMDKELKDIQTRGGGDNLLATINELNLALDKAGKPRVEQPTENTTADQMWIRILEGMERLGMNDRKKSTLLGNLGYADPSVVALMIRGSENMKKMLVEQEGIYVVTQKNIDASEQLWKQWYELEQRAKSLGQVLLHDLFGPIDTLLKAGQMAVAGATSRAQGNQPGSFGGAMMMPPLWPFGPSGTGGPAGGKDRSDSKYVAPPSGADEDPNIPNNAMPRSFQRSRVTQPGGGESHVGAASFYTGLPSEGGNRTSTGDMVRPDTYTGALQTDLAKKYGGLRKGGVWADVIDDKTGKRVRVFLNDTGPLRPGRMVDLSPKAFQEFAPLSRGVVPNLRMEILPPAKPGEEYKGGPQQGGGGPFQSGAPPVPWLSNPRLLRSPRFNQTLNPTQNYATSEMTVHSLIVNSADKPITDDAYGLSTDAIPSLQRGNYMTQMTEGPQ